MEWPEATRGVGMGRGVPSAPSPLEMGSGKGQCSLPIEKMLWIFKWKCGAFCIFIAKYYLGVRGAWSTSWGFNYPTPVSWHQECTVTKQRPLICSVPFTKNPLPPQKMSMAIRALILMWWASQRWTRRISDVGLFCCSRAYNDILNCFVYYFVVVSYEWFRRYFRIQKGIHIYLTSTEVHLFRLTI